MSKTTYERGKTLSYPNIYPILTFTPIFGHRGDFIWIEKVEAAWPEHDSEFAFVRDTVHDERVDSLKDENDKLRELVNDMWICISHGSEGWDCTGCIRDPDSVCIGGISEFSQRMRELGVKADE